jgi:hypothetical protein
MLYLCLTYFTYHLCLKNTTGMAHLKIMSAVHIKLCKDLRDLYKLPNIAKVKELRRLLYAVHILLTREHETH